MPSAKMVAQKPFGSVIPPLSPGQEAPGGLADDGVAPSTSLGAIPASSTHAALLLLQMVKQP
jgi:hypothetical protein